MGSNYRSWTIISICWGLYNLAIRVHSSVYANCVRTVCKYFHRVQNVYCPYVKRKWSVFNIIVQPNLKRRIFTICKSKHINK